MVSQYSRWLKGLVILCAFVGCNVKSTIEDAVDAIEEPSRKAIDRSITGVNAFVNDSRFGSISDQFKEVKNTLNLRYVRVLFAWNDEVQPSPGSEINFGFYDAIVDGLPVGVDALVILTGLPSWMRSSSNWTDGDPRATFVSRWVRAVVSRYGGNRRIVGWQIWNEQNDPANGDNATLGILDNPENYVDMLGRAHSVCKDLAPSKVVVSGATTAINQNFPDTLDYNRGMRDAGAEEFLDVWAIHYYGKQYENVIRGGGIQDFFNGVSSSIWVTESGAQGVNSQLEYVERTWPFLKEKLPQIQRFYLYQFTESTDASITYGLRNLTPGASVSDLYVYLRDLQ